MPIAILLVITKPIMNRYKNIKHHNNNININNNYNNKRMSISLGCDLIIISLVYFGVGFSIGLSIPLHPGIGIGELVEY